MENAIHFRLEELRKAKHITQQTLAEYCGVSFQTVSKWEKGINLPDITMLPLLASFFGISIDELLGVVPLKEEQYQSIWEDSEGFWNQKLDYLQRTRGYSWNEDYLQFLVEKVWKIREPIHVLDCGCGYGYMGVLLMPLLPEGSKYTGVDIAQNLVEQGKKILKENQILGEIVQDDFLHPKVWDETGKEDAKFWQNQKYDIVLCQSVLRHIGNAKEFVAKMLSMAKTGALIVCIDTNREFECTGLYVDGMDYADLCDHTGMWKYWKKEFENGERDYAAAMRNAYVMKELGVKNIEIRMNDKVSFVHPEIERYEQVKEDFMESENLWNEKYEGVCEMLFKHGMTRAEAKGFCKRKQELGDFLENHPDVCYTRFRGKMITFGYKA